MTDPCKCPLCGERQATTTNGRLWALERLARAVVAYGDRYKVQLSTAADIRKYWAIGHEYEAALEEVRKWV